MEHNCTYGMDKTISDSKTMRPFEHTPLAGLSRAVELAQGTVSLDVLREIDRAVDMLADAVHRMNDETRQLLDIADNVKERPVVKGVFLDADDHAIDALAKAEVSLKERFSVIAVRHVAIDQDADLSSEHREDLHSAYEEWQAAATAKLQVMRVLRNAIIAHDLAAEDRDSRPRFDTVEELLADLHK